jgi:malate dehydrogenase (oxaloacetate-decarboxylating)(NADP+)
MVYMLGVAKPHLMIVKGKDLAWRYANKDTLAAVIADGSVVWRLGDVGPLESKPVMEGKSVLLEKHTNVDTFDMELSEN